MLGACLLAAALVAVASGCGGSGSHASAPKRQVLEVKLTSQGCSPKRLAAKSGRMTFVVVNSGTNKVSELEVRKTDGVVLGERENVVGKNTSGTFGLRLSPGHYVLACPLPFGGGNGTLAVAGQPIRHTAEAMSQGAPVTLVQLSQPLNQYRDYESAQLARVRGQLATLALRLRQGDLAGAQAAWLAAHMSWLRLGQDDGAYGAFGNLGNRIDGTADGDVGTTSSPSFTGFHRVELDLWSRHDLAAARPDTATLSRLVGSIDARTVREDLPATTLALDAWVLRAHEILEDALRDSLTQNDNYGSNSDLAAIHTDVTATREMLRVLGPQIDARSPGLVARAQGQLNAVDAALAAAPPHAQLAALPPRSRQRIDATVGAALETLAPVSELMEVA
jgi:high-affinity iron transporter